MRTVNLRFKYAWLIAAALVLFSCARNPAERDPLSGREAKVERTQWGDSDDWHWPWRHGFGRDRDRDRDSCD